MVKIDGQTYNVPFENCDISADFLDKYAERTEDGILHRELTGVYINYVLKIGPTTNVREFTRFWNKITEPTEFHTVTVPGVDGDYTFVAYFNGIKTSVKRQYNNKNYFGGVSINFTSRSPARTPK